MSRPPPAKTVQREPAARRGSWWLGAVQGSSFGNASRVRSLERSVARDLCQDLDVRRVDLDTSIGYALKRTATALRTAMEASLRSLGLSVPQYSCLEILNARPWHLKRGPSPGCVRDPPGDASAPRRLTRSRTRQRRRPGARPALLLDPRRTTNHRGRISGRRSGGGTHVVWLAAIRATAAAQRFGEVHRCSR